MDAKTLDRELSNLRLTQTEFARLLGISARTVRIWTSGDREIPGPVVAYLRLFSASPEYVRERELKIAKGNSTMISAIYAVKMIGTADTGIATLIISDGRIFGVDEGRVNYDGVYSHDLAKNLVRCAMRVSVPAGTWTVQGVTPSVGQFYDVVAEFPADAKAYSLVVSTPHGPVKCEINWLRDLPDLAA